MIPSFLFQSTLLTLLLNIQIETIPKFSIFSIKLPLLIYPCCPIFSLQSVAQTEIQVESDWNKVVITNYQADVDGLIKAETPKAETIRPIDKDNKKSMTANSAKKKNALTDIVRYWL